MSQAAAELRGELFAKRVEVFARCQLLVAVDDPETDAQVIGQRRPVEIRRFNQRPVEHPHLGRKVFAHITGRGIHPVEQLAGKLGHRHKIAAQVFGKGPDQSGNEFLAVAGHTPAEIGGVDRCQIGERHVDRHAVVDGAGLEGIRQRVCRRLRMPLTRELGVDSARSIGPQQVLGGEGQQLGIGPAGLFPPRVEMAARHGLGTQTRVIKGIERLVVDPDVSAAYAVLDLIDFFEQRTIVGEETVIGLPLALDEGMADK